jgi:hypothetical protein
VAKISRSVSTRFTLLRSIISCLSSIFMAYSFLEARCRTRYTLPTSPLPARHLSARYMYLSPIPISLIFLKASEEMEFGPSELVLFRSALSVLTRSFLIQYNVRMYVCMYVCIACMYCMYVCMYVLYVCNVCMYVCIVCM